MTDCDWKTTAGSVRIDRLMLESGEALEQVDIAFERVGNADGQLILVCHALTGNQFAKGSEDDKGWWDCFIGPDSYIDTNVFQIITMNVIGGCNGSTGPASLNPKTGEKYGRGFPAITIRDMVHAQYLALRRLGYSEAKAVIGGSLGGMQVLEWGILYPYFADILIPMAVTPYFTDYALAFNSIGRRAIMTDPLWNNGEYQEDDRLKGLEIARMVGLVTYRSASLFNHRFSREQKVTGEDSAIEYQVDSYMKYQGEKFARRFDANSYLCLLQAMDQFDIGWQRNGWKKALQRIMSRVCIIGFSNDLLYPASMISEAAGELKAQGKTASFVEVVTEFGHDGFLVEFEKWGMEVKQLLEGKERKEVTHV